MVRTRGGNLLEVVKGTHLPRRQAVPSWHLEQGLELERGGADREQLKGCEERKLTGEGAHSLWNDTGLLLKVEQEALLARLADPSESAENV